MSITAAPRFRSAPLFWNSMALNTSLYWPCWCLPNSLFPLMILVKLGGRNLLPFSYFFIINRCYSSYHPNKFSHRPVSVYSNAPHISQVLFLFYFPLHTTTNASFFYVFVVKYTLWGTVLNCSPSTEKFGCVFAVFRRCTSSDLTAVESVIPRICSHTKDSLLSELVILK